jgi:hypothetical protein
VGTSLFNLFYFEKTELELEEKLTFVHQMGKVNLELSQTLFTMLMAHYLTVKPGNMTTKPYSEVLGTNQTRFDFYLQRLQEHSL